MGVHAAKLLISLRAPVHKNTAGNLFLDFRPASCSAFCFYSSMNEIRITSRYKNGSNGARTHDLSRVRRTLIPAELCFHVLHYSTMCQKCNSLSDISVFYMIFCDFRQARYRPEVRADPQKWKKNGYFNGFL